jgi:hypothetical protein
MNLMARWRKLNEEGRSKPSFMEYMNKSKKIDHGLMDNHKWFRIITIEYN